jgi:predicted RNase H-like HicB family nuclease
MVTLSIELEREDDGRWIAEALEISGVMCYGTTREEAIGNTERLAIEVIADRIAHGETPASSQERQHGSVRGVRATGIPTATGGLSARPAALSTGCRESSKRQKPEAH